MSEERLAADDWKETEIENINMQVIDKFLKVQSMAGAPDPELSLSLGVMHFTAQDFEKALIFFKQASDLDPTNYSYWNKLGATYAHLKKPEESLQCYHKALDLKPTTCAAGPTWPSTTTRR